MREDLPELWVRICRLAGISGQSGVDALHRRLPDVPRGNLQRIREGKGPRHSTLQKLSDELKVPMAQLLSDEPVNQPAAWPFQFVDLARWRDCEPPGG